MFNSKKVEISEDVYEQLKAYCDKNDVTVDEFVEQAIIAHMIRE